MTIELLIISFIAGVLTVLSPCVLPVLPVIIGGSLTNKDKWRPLIIVVSLGVSVIFFTLILKASTALIDVPEVFWKVVSGGIVLGLGIVTLFPSIWDQISIKIGLESSSNRLLEEGSRRGSLIGSAVVGAALGPVFASCSPTYALILVTILPQDFATGLIYLLVYTFGMSIFLLLVALFGQAIVERFKWAANPSGKFKRGLGILFIVVGLAVITGIDKQIEAYLITEGILNATNIEFELLKMQ